MVASPGSIRSELPRIGRQITVHYGRRVAELVESVLLAAEPARGASA